MNNAHASAYPSVAGDPGLTKREIFAAMAMQGIFANGVILERHGLAGDDVAKAAVNAADALLARLSETVSAILKE